MNFFAIDFETANFKRNSACSVGIAKVQDGRVVETWSSFIRPTNMHFEPRCVAIHGITEKDVESAPMFGDVWASQLERIVACNPVVAHNAGFDLSVLRACCDEYC
ncbi:MAG: DNA polymerase III subunit epsilon, partial [Phycisphaerae bacterium]|nr:DNA polymerase III subunit epsilon [Phycisphaerae bacterium]